MDDIIPAHGTPNFPTEPAVTFAGSRNIRRGVISLLTNCFSKLKLTELYRWDKRNENTKLYIASKFSDETEQYPHVLVGVVPVDPILTGFGGYSKRDPDTGDLKSSGLYNYSVEMRVADYGLDKVEDISIILLHLFGTKYIWENVLGKYGINFDPSKRFGASGINTRDLNVSRKKEYFATVYVGVQTQWVSQITGPDIETICGETFVMEHI